MKGSEILGMNARNAVYLPENPPEKRKYANSKIISKKLFLENDIPSPKVLAIFAKPERVMEFSWEDLPESFVLKPEGTYAGKGVLVVKRGGKWAGEWWTASGEKVSIKDLRLHALDILEGRFSTFETENRAFIEERVPVHPVFSEYSYKGTPDVRILVYNWVPVMAMLRLPTEESGGRANLHQGAVGVGIDMATGITTHGFVNGKKIERLPRTQKKLNGIKIPYWEKMLKMSIRCQQITQLGFLGVDIVLDPEKGPLVLELNAKPGLSIQVANMTGLRRRLRRVRGLDVRNPDHGVKISQSLFAAQFADRVKAEEGLKIIQFQPSVEVFNTHKSKQVQTRVNTGWKRSAISEKLAKELDLYNPEDVLWQEKGKRERNPVIEVKIKLKGRKIKTAMKVLQSLNNKNYQLVLGRNDVSSFLISVQED